MMSHSLKVCLVLKHLFLPVWVTTGKNQEGTISHEGCLSLTQKVDALTSEHETEEQRRRV